MVDLTHAPDLAAIQRQLPQVFSHARRATELLRRRWNPADGTPVFTIRGRYTSRGWTEWTQGFQFGNAVYLFDATGDEEVLEYGKKSTINHMASHVSHVGVHDHGFNNVSTYGNLLRLKAEGRLPGDDKARRNAPRKGEIHPEWEAEFYRMALKASAAVQASRWTDIGNGLGYIHSFNGAHSLFSDTVRTLRVLALGHQFGHVLMGEQDRRISLLTRLLQHAETTARYNVYFGTGRDSYDIRGRVVHESIFNAKNGLYRCASTQQGYSPFSTWTRGHAWVLSGYPELLEWLRTRDPEEIERAAASIPGHRSDRLFTSAADVEARFLTVACAVADFYLEQMPADGIPYWDTGAPGLVHMGDYQNRPADPFNSYEPVDSSAGAISAQGLLRLGRYLIGESDRLAAEQIIRSGEDWSDAPTSPTSIRNLGNRYITAGLITADTLLKEPYLNTKPDHEGILLHSVYHRPNGWDFAPDTDGVPRGESCMWGDYHLLELAVYLQRLDSGAVGEAVAAGDTTRTDETPAAAGAAGAGSPYLTFFNVEAPGKDRLGENR